MNNTGIQTNAKEIYDLFCGFTTKEMKRALTNALKTSARTLVKNTKTQLKASGIKNANKRNPKYNDTLMQGIRNTRVREDDEGELYIKVRIDSNRKHGSGSFRLGILEKGNYKTLRYAYTKTKTGHKPAYRGNLRAYNFFNDANASFNSTYDQTMSQSFEKAVTKINDKKFK